MPAISLGDNLLLETVSQTGPGQTFTFPAKPDGGDFSVTFEADSGTTISADLQISVNGSAFTNYIPTLITAAGAKVVNSAGSTPIVAGAVYKLNYTTLTGTWNIRISRN